MKSAPLTPDHIASYRRTYASMLGMSGMDASAFKAACEAHPAFDSLYPAPVRYCNAALRIARNAQVIAKTAQRTAARAAYMARTADSTCPCERCGGLGIIVAYKHVAGGVCYDCEGTGKAL